MKKVKLAGSVTVYVLILVGMMIGFYLFGYTSIMMNAVDSGLAQDETDGGQQPEVNADALIGNIVKSIADNWALFGIAIGGALLISLLTGGATIASFLAVFFPVFILLYVSNLFFFPIVTDVTKFDLGPVGLLLAFVFNTLMVLTIVEFISGRK